MITPIEKMYSEKNNVYIKRDDLLPFSFGGNKARKSKYFFQEIEKQKNDVVVTYGSSSSNHCRIVANKACANGIKCYIISPEENYKKTANSKMIDLFDAEVIKVPISFVAKTIDELMKKLRTSHNPYFIPGGGHGNLGTQAYIDAYEEICEYESENGIKFDYIFLASGTGTTQAGLIAGKIINKRHGQKIIGISIAREQEYGKSIIVDSLSKYFDDNSDYESEVFLNDEYICGGYGDYNDEIISTIRNTIRNNGIAFNTTYTGKAFWGMEQYLKKNKIQDKNVLFINTGGTPLFFDVLEGI